MDFAQSSSQQILPHTARTFLQQRCPPERVQALALDPSGFADDLWKEMAALGWAGLLMPPDNVGSGGSAIDVVTLLEEMGRACLPGPFIESAVVATSVLLTAAPTKTTRQLLQAMAVGERITTIAGAEDHDPQATAPGMTRVDGTDRLDGRKLFVKDAHAATDVI